jgi:polygalacturonase
MLNFVGNKPHYMKQSALLSLLFLLQSFTAQLFAADYDVRRYGAKGDGITLDSHAINAAITAAAKAGGGRVVLSAGRYLSGTIRLKSNIELHLDAGAVLLATSEKSAYDPSEPFNFPEYQDGGHTYFHNSLIWAEGEENVSITGPGMIDGSGLTRMDTEKAGQVQGGSIGMGDKAVALKLCRNLLIRDVTITRGGHFAIIATGCERGNIDNVTIDTNRDGIDIDCCKYITVTNCKVNTPNDDGIVLKSSYALKKTVACEHILISNCLVTGYKVGTFLDGTYVPEQVNWVCGRIKLGTESNGGFRNVTISNCNFMYSSGLALEEVDQGRMENIVVSNLSMVHVHHYPIYITTGCRNRGPKEVTETSYGGDIMISHVVAQDCDSLASIIITGMPGAPLKRITLSDIQIEYQGGGKAELRDKTYREQGTNYPEPRWAGPTPAYGLYARHVDGLNLRNIHFRTLRPDYRHRVILDDVKNVEMVDVTGPVEQGAQAVYFAAQ